MLLVRTRLDRSPVDGIGVFAAERIAKGSVVWQFAPAIDQILHPEELATLSAAAREQIEKYIYVDRKTREIILCGDDARFFNHAERPNVIDDAHDPYRCIAARDILIGEELLCDYHEFDAAAGQKLQRETGVARLRVSTQRKRDP